MRQDYGLLEFDGYRAVVHRRKNGHMSVVYVVTLVAVGAHSLDIYFTAGTTAAEQPVFKTVATARLVPAVCMGHHWYVLGPPAWLKDTPALLRVHYKPIVAEEASRKRPRVEGGEEEEPAAKASRPALTIDLADAVDGDTLEEKEKEKD
jgi:hypothetical protein